MTIEELKEKCVEQLEVMSKKRIKRILAGKDKKAPYIHIIILKTLLHNHNGLSFKRPQHISDTCTL